MKPVSWLYFAMLAFVGAVSPMAFAAQATEPTTLTIFAAGTLAVPFKQVSALFEKEYPNVTVQAQFGGSVKMAKQITDLHQDADLLAVADYNVIPKYLFGNPAYASWYVGFARNAITFVYTDKSKYAGEINSEIGTRCLPVKASRSAAPIRIPIHQAIRQCRCSIWPKNIIRSLG